MLKVGALLVVVALVSFSYANLRPCPIRIQVTFTGFTNSLAYFCVSNAGKGSVVENWMFGYDTKSEAATTGVGLAEKSLMSELKPGQFKTISLPPPWDNREPWRAELYFSKADWRYKLSQKPPWVLEMIRPLVSERWLIGNHPVEVYSDWVNGPELVPTTTNSVKIPPE